MGRGLTGTRMPWAALVAFGLGAVSCAGPSAHLPIDEGAAAPCCQVPSRSVQVQYLGVEGYLIQWGDRALLTAPLFSNPTIRSIALWTIRPNPERIERFLPPVDHVDDILVGHAHYDHLLDVPYIATHLAPQARIFGSQTAVNILMAALPEDRLVVVNSTAGTAEEPGYWHYSRSGAFRFMALESEHAPHYRSVKLFSGKVEQPLKRLPGRASYWREGQTYSYLIDLLHPDGSVAFRIHFQDAASTPPAGFPPDMVGKDAAPVDLAITCVPGFAKVQGYPERVIRHLQPRYVLLGHWENLFAEPTGERHRLRTVPMTDVEEFIRRLELAMPGGGRSGPCPCPGAATATPSPGAEAATRSGEGPWRRSDRRRGGDGPPL
ncbi:MBL fold metallo-hydrolase [Candidatus Latescibacterota bacterium]